MTSSASLRRAADGESMDRVARVGLAARAVIYLLVGALALSLAFGDRGGETDQRGAMQALAAQSGGFVLVLVLAIGLAAYALWRFVEAVFGVTGDGNGAGPRLQSAARGVVYSVLAFSAFSVLAGRGSSQADQQESISARVMEHDFGRWLVGIVGIVVVAIGAVLIHQGVTREFEKYFKLGEMSPRARRTTEFLGTVGTSARGVVFGIAGVLVVIAAVDFQPSKARGIDAALRSLRRLPLGPWLLGIIALGVIMFGLFCLCEARWRRT